MRTVIVVGGGASGMMAAIAAASKGGRVTLLEHKERVGKKLLSTGNGRCNFTNTHQEPIFYHSHNALFPWGIIEKFHVQDTISFFLTLGIYSKNRNGYLYPASDQASSVLDVLRTELDRLNVEIQTGVHCTQISPQKSGFLVHAKREGISCDLHADKVILCTGSKAAPVTGSDGSGYNLAEQLGHRILPVLPALVQLRCEGKFFKSISGVRVNGGVSIYANEECIVRDSGEIQITEYGISGIPVFQVSRYASQMLYRKKKVEAELDFMPDFTQEQLRAFLDSRIRMRPEKSMDQFLIGMFHKKLAQLWIKMSSIPREKKAEQLTVEERMKLVRLIKCFRVTVTGTNSFEQAQVCCGGVDTDQVDSETLESKLVPGLYFAGEILDVDGICGGYNLQWAWASGHVAGISCVL